MMTEQVFLSLGSNLGNRRRSLERAVELLTKSVRVKKVSSIYETEPVGDKQQGPFLNLALQASTTLSPFLLLDLCLSIERRMGRRRQRDKSSRVIDIDLLFHNQRLIVMHRLELPHPALRERRFVLVPLNEIAPHFRDPRSGKSIAQLLETCPDSNWVARVSRFTLHPPCPSGPTRLLGESVPIESPTRKGL